MNYTNRITLDFQPLVFGIVVYYILQQIKFCTKEYLDTFAKYAFKFYVKSYIL